MIFVFFANFAVRFMFFLSPHLRLAYNILLRAPACTSAATDAVLRMRHGHDLGAAQVISIGMVDILEHPAPTGLEAFSATSAVIDIASHHKGGSPAPA